MEQGASEFAEAAARWAGWDLDNDDLTLLERYAAWLIEEAIPAGGLGPNEAARIWHRHIADSLTFACGWEDRPPGDLLDVGSGVGLPGIPLAILWPDSRVLLLDRGGRRTRLLERVARILDLGNIIVMKRDIQDVSGQFDGVVFRGSIRAADTPAVAHRLLGIEGTAVVGLSHRREPPATAGPILSAAEGLGLDAALVAVPDSVLDGPGWLLKMRRRSG